MLLGVITNYLTLFVVSTYPQSTEDVTIIGHSSTPQPSLLCPHSPPHHPSNLPLLNCSRTPDSASDDITIMEHWTMCLCLGALLHLPLNLSRTFWRQTASTSLLRGSRVAASSLGWVSLPRMTVVSISVSRGHKHKSRFGIKSSFKGK